MASIRKLKSRIKTSKNISKITRAMEMVAASKMKRAQEKALSGRPYSQELTNVLHRLSHHTDPQAHPLLSPGNPDSPPLYVIISTDKGLCGALNTNLFTNFEKTFNSQLSKSNVNRDSVKVISIGKKSRDYCAKSNLDMLASFVDLPDQPDSEDIRPVAKMITQGFINRQYSQVWVTYPEFISTLSQETRIIQLLPLGKINIELSSESPTLKDKTPPPYLFEPSPHQILNQLLPLYIENRLYQLLLESKASEHSARMISMKNAHDNAQDLSTDLNLTYNRLRQARVTNELLDAVGSRMALS